MHMKKVFSRNLLVAAAFLSPIVVHADLQRIAVQQITAAANLTGAGTISFDASVHVMADGSPAAGMTWPAVSLPAGFTLASTYIQINSTITASNGAIEVYTDNLHGQTDLGLTYNPAGLVSSHNPQAVLPLAWSMKASALAPPAANPNNNTTDPQSFQWFFMKDHAYIANQFPHTPNQYPPHPYPFVDGEDYVTILKAGLFNGVQPNQFFPAPSATYMFLEADFTKAVTPETYTGAITLEAFTQ